MSQFKRSTRDRTKRRDRLTQDDKQKIGMRLLAVTATLQGAAGFVGPLIVRLLMPLDFPWGYFLPAYGISIAVSLVIGLWAVGYYTTDLRRQAEDARDELKDLKEEMEAAATSALKQCPRPLFMMYLALLHANAFVGNSSHIARMIGEISDGPLRSDMVKINAAIRNLPVIFQEKHRCLLEAIVPILRSEDNMGDLNGIKYVS